MAKKKPNKKQFQKFALRQMAAKDKKKPPAKKIKGKKGKKLPPWLMKKGAAPYPVGGK